MARLFGFCLLACLLGLIFTALVIRAYGYEQVEHMLITRNGITLDCERITDVRGRVFYDSCVRVP
jgi:hypothetical protein